MNNKTRLILILSFILTLCIFAGLMTYTLSQFDSVRIKSEAIVQNNNTKVDLINTMHIAARNRVRDMFIMMNIDDPFDLDEAVTKFHNQGRVFTKARIALEKMVLNPQERRLLGEQSEFQKVSVPIQLQIIAYIESENRQNALELLYKEGVDAQKNTLSKLVQLIDLQRESSQKILNDIDQQHSQSVKLILTWSVFAFILGSILAFSAVLRISRAEKQISRINAELETRVESRTQALQSSNNQLMETIETLETTQQQLVESEKLASLGGLVAGIAHEVNTPLGVGLTSSTLLKEKVQHLKKLISTQQLSQSALTGFIQSSEETCDILEDNLHKAGELIASFKQLAVDQSSNQVYTFNLSDSIKASIDSLHHKLKQQNAVTDLQCPADYTTYNNAGAFSQIITNLIMNASLHAFDETIESPKISLNVVDSGVDNYTITFIDNGIGMSKNTLDKIFEPFFTTKRGQGGTGLGMHLVYNLVNKTLHGNIQVQSEKGKGTTFILTIPKQNDDPDAALY